MCMEDYKIGRETVSRAVPITVGNAQAIEVLSSSPLRTALMLGAPLTGQITYLPDAGPVLGLGFTLSVGSNPIQLTIQLDGEIVKKQWWAIADAAARVAAVAETILERTK